MKFFTHYWSNNTWSANRDSEEPLDYIAGNQFSTRGVEVGDTIYVVTVLEGKLYLGGKMTVGYHCGPVEAARRLPYDAADLWEANEYLIAERATPLDLSREVSSQLVQSLSFVTEKGMTRSPIFSRPGHLNEQTMRGVRQLTANSAAALDALLPQAEPITNTSEALAGKSWSNEEVDLTMFRISKTYTRRQIFDILSVPEERRGGDWLTGYHKHQEEWFVFAGVGVPGRNGHDYENKWIANRLFWKGKTGSRLRQTSISELVGGEFPVNIFWRSDNRAAFSYAGLARAAEVRDTVPVTVVWSFDVAGQIAEGTLAEEVSDSSTHVEGAAFSVTVNGYERNPAARRECLAHHGFACSVCGFSFQDVYGELGHKYIHVHHIKPLHEIRAAYIVDPIRDLLPICPNCHAMIHRESPPLTVERLQTLLREVAGRPGRK